MIAIRPTRIGFLAILWVWLFFAWTAKAQNTPAPCSPANIQYTYIQEGCYNSVDCSSGYECIAIRVATDVVYGSTCDETPVYYCYYPFPGGPNGAVERKDHAKAILASIRARSGHRS